MIGNPNTDNVLKTQAKDISAPKTVASSAKFGDSVALEGLDDSVKRRTGLLLAMFAHPPHKVVKGLFLVIILACSKSNQNSEVPTSGLPRLLAGLGSPFR